LALDYAIALSSTPAVVSQDLFDALRKELSEKQLVELTAVIAFENQLARFNRGFAIEPLGFSEGAVCPLPDHLAEG
jgi:alkylhydroperoxidase family enzyme